jgi:hypothetical protein
MRKEEKMSAKKPIYTVVNSSYGEMTEKRFV